MIIAPIPLAPVVKPVVVDPTPQSVTKKCSAGCGSMIVEGHGFVLPISDLYIIIRGTADQPEYPLTRSEVLAQEICFSCRKKVAGKTYPTEGTLRVMAGRVSANFRKMEAADKLKAFQEREARKSKKFVRHSRDSEHMLDTIAESAERARRQATRKKHHRLPAAERRRLAETKTSRSFVPTPSKNGKKQKGGDKNKRGRK
jgi:hypothetical protein